MSAALGQMFGLVGKRAPVTGSSQGIGLTLARGMLRAGAVVPNRRNAGRVTTACDDLDAEFPGAEVDSLDFDVTRHDDVRAAIDGFERDRGGIDIRSRLRSVEERKGTIA